VKKNIAYVGLGSNIEQPYLQIKKAIMSLDALPEIIVLNDSGYFKSKPMGPKDQPNYINAVVAIETTMTADELLQQCQYIEQQQGRIRLRRWGERSIDMDILLYANQQIQTDDLTVPHPGICLRDFVYMPLLKLDPEIFVPGRGLLNTTIEKQTAEKYKTDYDCQFAGNIDR
jgi:2-amino-4-hydroxy-6-hydroxymethyldihydropteridine diphosphokinase